ncbi:hypothetical protein BX666DRAFT_2025391 [Dichotomocladium elegans]|nr:hypothetical protein BX666DRAFT_2025391 [Dichotomocladium elegans]
MSDRRNYSPIGRAGDTSGGGSAGGYRGDWSDDESSMPTHGREKFRQERSLERDQGSYSRNPDDYDRYDRKKRLRRSITPPDERRHIKRRASPHAGDYGNLGRSRHDRDPRDLVYEHHDGDHYIPNYDRDGYAPAPRYSSVSDSHSGARGFGYPMVNVRAEAAVVVHGHHLWEVDLDQLDYIVSFKQFCEHLRSVHSRSQFDEDELQKRYQHYKEKVQARQLNNFFNSNKDKQWFLEKYHPTASRERLADMKKRRQQNLKQFMSDLNEGKYDDVDYDAPAAKVESTSATDKEPMEELSMSTSAPVADKPTGTSSSGTSAVDQEYENQLVIKTVPPTIARQRIIEMCSEVEGFEYLVLSEPSPSKKFHRIGWIHFKEGTDMQKALDALDNRKVDDFVFHLAMNPKNSQQKRTSKVTFEAASTLRRLQKDLDQAKDLSNVLESELASEIKGLQAVCDRAKQVISKGKPNDKDVEHWEVKKELDMVFAYLRNVHMYCYYCSIECDSLEEINRRCTEPHFRKISGSSEEADQKQVAKNEKAATQWLKNLDQKIAMRIRSPDDHDLEKWGGKILDKEIDTFIKEHVLKEHEAKFKCRVGDCAKAFKGFEYVEKHIIAKHPEEINAIKEETKYYNNYVCDPNHLVPIIAHGSASNAGMGGGMPFGMSSFVLPGMRPPLFQGAMPGTPWDQIPRIGFTDGNWSARRRGTPNGKGVNERLGRGMDIDEPMPRDPRQVKSYVDLDAPAEGEADISFY